MSAMRSSSVRLLRLDQRLQEHQKLPQEVDELEWLDESDMAVVSAYFFC